MYKKIAASGIIIIAVLLAGCAPQVRPDHDYRLQREAIAGTHKPVPAPLNVGTGQQNQPLAVGAQPETHYGTGVFINATPAPSKVPGGTNQGGTITFNFDNQPVQAAVQAILGDVLHANYAISPQVKGTVTFSTSQPVTKEEVLPILQMLLSWTGNALVQRSGSYLVVPVDQAAPGTLVPGLGAVSPGSGYAAQLFPLHYVSAEAMQKLLKPFAEPKAFLLVDPIRNLLVMGGTPDELANYRNIIRTFDVDWLRGMSVAVIPLQHVQAEDLVGQLRTLFGEQGEKGQQMSSLVRLLPLKHSNSLVVITSQPSYIDEVRRLVTTIDNGAGNSSGLYVYNVLNVKASDLARHLNELFGNTTGNGQQSSAGAVAPGFSPLEQAAPGSLGAQQGFGGFSSNNSFGNGTGQGGGDEFGSGGVGAGMVQGATQARRQQQMGQQGTLAFTTSEGVRIAAVNENNQLLIRAKPGQWEKLLPVIERLDEKPLQVQIETRVLEVDLTGEFQFGVQYFLSHVESGSQIPPSAIPIPPIPTPQPYGLFYTFAGRNLAAAISALDSSSDVKVLSAPSSVVLNNQETTFKVGEKIPVVQTYLAPGLGVGTAGVNVGQVQYIDTGVLLDVVPRVSPGGLVYMDVQQIVSKPGVQDKFGNYTISNRALSTEVAVQSGQTVLLGGLIQQSNSTVNNGIPFLDRIPVVGHLFGNTDRNNSRTELIVLITPRIIRNPEDARRVTDEYQTQFESLRPILPGGSAAPATLPVPTSSLQPVEAPVARPTGWAVQVATLTELAPAESLRGRLQQLGYASYLTSAQTVEGGRWLVFAGPVISREAAERLRTVIAEALHIGGMRITPPPPA
ncbi:MAG: secretin N-terminal domain-containing protein [Rhodanobacteraceae bacterium]